MLAVPGVVGIHDLHVWALTSGKASLTAHVVHDRAFPPEEGVIPALQAVLAQRFKVAHTTLQCETTPCAHQAGCTYVAGTPEPGGLPHHH